MTDNSEQSQTHLASNERCPHGIGLTSNPPCHFCEHAREIEPCPDCDQLRRELANLHAFADDREAAAKRLEAERDRLRAALQEIVQHGHKYAGVAVDVAREALSGEPNSASETKAARDVLGERRRQVESEGWHAAHDDEHDTHQLAAAAGCYALHASDRLRSEHGDYDLSGTPIAWPWASSRWKPRDVRRDLVRAGALILAEIERLDRLSGAPESAVKATAECRGCKKGWERLGAWHWDSIGHMHECTAQNGSATQSGESNGKR